MVSTSTIKQWIIQTNQNKGGQNIDDDTLTSRADLVIGRADSSDAINLPVHLGLGAISSTHTINLEADSQYSGGH